MVHYLLRVATLATRTQVTPSRMVLSASHTPLATTFAVRVAIISGGMPRRIDSSVNQSAPQTVVPFSMVS